MEMRVCPDCFSKIYSVKLEDGQDIYGCKECGLGNRFIKTLSLCNICSGNYERFTACRSQNFELCYFKANGIWQDLSEYWQCKNYGEKECIKDEQLLTSLKKWDTRKEYLQSEHLRKEKLVGRSIFETTLDPRYQAAGYQKGGSNSVDDDDPKIESFRKFYPERKTSKRKRLMDTRGLVYSLIFSGYSNGKRYDKSEFERTIYTTDVSKISEKKSSKFGENWGQFTNLLFPSGDRAKKLYGDFLRNLYEVAQSVFTPKQFTVFCAYWDYEGTFEYVFRLDDTTLKDVAERLNYNINVVKELHSDGEKKLRKYIFNRDNVSCGEEVEENILAKAEKRLPHKIKYYFLKKKVRYYDIRNEKLDAINCFHQFWIKSPKWAKRKLEISGEMYLWEALTKHKDLWFNWVKTDKTVSVLDCLWALNDILGYSAYMCDPNPFYRSVKAKEASIGVFTSIYEFWNSTSLIKPYLKNTGAIHIDKTLKPIYKAEYVNTERHKKFISKHYLSITPKELSLYDDDVKGGAVKNILYLWGEDTE